MNILGPWLRLFCIQGPAVSRHCWRLPSPFEGNMHHLMRSVSHLQTIFPFPIQRKSLSGQNLNLMMSIDKNLSSIGGNQQCMAFLTQSPNGGTRWSRWNGKRGRGCTNGIDFLFHPTCRDTVSTLTIDCDPSHRTLPTHTKHWSVLKRP